MTRKPIQSDKAQSERFIETARALGCDEDEAAFREKLRVIARQKPKDDPQQASSLKPRARRGGSKQG